jgi:hypothetical protein
MAIVQAVSNVPLGNHPAAAWVLALLVAVFFLVALVFARLSIEIDEAKIRLRLGLLRKEIPLSEVTVAVYERAKAEAYFGLGLRYGTDGSVAFIAFFGDAVKVTRKNGRSVVFSTHHPSEVVQRVNPSAPGGQVR